MLQWRLLHDGADSGAWNMAVDESLLWSQARATQSTLCAGDAPTLRFYDWNPACLSLGRFQKARDVSAFAVRRPTGGRAVWHQHEITYSMTLRLEALPPDATSTVGSYRWLNNGLLRGLQSLGVNAQLSSPETRGAPRDENCFLSAAQCDAVVDNRKLIGAAQCRKNIDGRVVLLQHGSILLDIDEAAWREHLGGAMETVTSLRQLGVTQTREKIIAALCDGIQSTLAVRLVPGALTPDERNRARCWHDEKYTRDEWNRDGREIADGALCN